MRERVQLLTQLCGFHHEGRNTIDPREMLSGDEKIRSGRYRMVEEVETIVIMWMEGQQKRLTVPVAILSSFACESVILPL